MAKGGSNSDDLLHSAQKSGDAPVVRRRVPSALEDRLEHVGELELKEAPPDLGHRPPATRIDVRTWVAPTKVQAPVEEFKVPPEAIDHVIFRPIGSTVEAEPVEAPPAITEEQREQTRSFLRDFGIDPTGMTDAQLQEANKRAGDKLTVGGENDSDFTGVPTPEALNAAAEIAEVGGTTVVLQDGSIAVYDAEDNYVTTIPQGSDGVGFVKVAEDGSLVPTSDEGLPDDEGVPADEPAEPDDEGVPADEEDDDPEDDDNDEQAPPTDETLPDDEGVPADTAPEDEGTPTPDGVFVDPAARQRFLDSRLGKEQREQDEDAAEHAKSGGVTDPSDEGGGGGGGGVVDTRTGAVDFGPIRTPGGSEPLVDHDEVVVTVYDLDNLGSLAGGGPAAGPGDPDGPSPILPVAQDPRSPVPSLPPIAPGIRGDVLAQDAAHAAGSQTTGSADATADPVGDASSVDLAVSGVELEADIQIELDEGLAADLD